MGTALYLGHNSEEGEGVGGGGRGGRQSFTRAATQAPGDSWAGQAWNNCRNRQCIEAELLLVSDFSSIFYFTIFFSCGQACFISLYVTGF